MAKIIQIETGQYTYTDKNGELASSHCLYKLDEDGNVYKYIVQEKRWVNLEDIKH